MFPFFTQPKIVLDAFLLHGDSFDTRAIIQQIKTKTNRWAFLQTGLDPRFLMSAPSEDQGQYFLPTLKAPFYFTSPFWFYLTYPIYLVCLWVWTFFYFLYFFCYKKIRVKTLIIAHPFYMVPLYPFLLIGWIKKSVYVAADWFIVESAERKKIWQWLGSRMIHPLCDGLSTRVSAVTVNYNPRIIQARRRYWRKEIGQAQIVYELVLEIKALEKSPNQLSHQVVFLGNARSDSGIELIYQALIELRKSKPFSLIFIGPLNQKALEFQSIVKKDDNESWVRWTGLADRSLFPTLFKDCFCGFNLITTDSSYTLYGRPSKIFDYFQHLLPVLSSRNVGDDIVALIEAKNLGVLPKALTVEEIKSAILSLFENQTHYRSSIREFLTTRSVTDFGQWID
jgi:hypothetical protein